MPIGERLHPSRLARGRAHALAAVGDDAPIQPRAPVEYHAAIEAATALDHYFDDLLSPVTAQTPLQRPSIVAASPARTHTPSLAKPL